MMTHSNGNIGFRDLLEATLSRGNPLGDSGGSRRQTGNNVFDGSGAQDGRMTESTSIPQKRRLSIPIPQGNLTLQPDIRSRDCEMVPCKSPRLKTPSTPGQLRVWNPAICTICMDDLFSLVETENHVSPLFSSVDNATGNNSNNFGHIHSQESREEDMRPTVSTRCGHLFHTQCINKWFKEKMESEIKECPFCRREMMANDTIRIFPCFGEV